MPYSENFLEYLDLPIDGNIEAFSDRIEELIPETPLGGLINNQTKYCLIENLSCELTFSTETAPLNSNFFNDSAYHEVRCSSSDKTICRILEIHKVNRISDLPSDGQRVLLLFIASTGYLEFPFLNENGDTPLQTDEFNVIFEWIAPSEKERDLIESIYSPRPTPETSRNDYNKHSVARLKPDGFYKKLEEFAILREAVLEKRIKWRFLSLYRILENGYIRNLLETIQRDIFFNPKDTISKATDSLANEYSQLVALIDKNGISHHFEEIQKATHRNRTNQFLTALNRKANEDKRSKNSRPFEKGAYIAYQIRCSIVHAGEMSLFFDKYNDAEAGLQEIYEHFDRAVFSYLGIEFIQ